MIPVSAIARVEVLTDGASAIYGSDAIGRRGQFRLGAMILPAATPPYAAGR